MTLYSEVKREKGWGERKGREEYNFLKNIGKFHSEKENNREMKRENNIRI